MFMLTYITVTLAIMGLFLILLPKAIFGRERPTRIVSVRRILNMRDLEHGKSMPSGDAMACAFFCSIYFYVFCSPWVFVALPLVCLGRVYVHCHWFCDTIIGTIMGLIFTFYTF